MKGARNKEKRIYVLLFHLNTILKHVKVICSHRKQIGVCLDEDGEGEPTEGITEGHKETFGSGGGYVHYLDFWGGLMVYTYFRIYQIVYFKCV